MLRSMSPTVARTWQHGVRRAASPMPSMTATDPFATDPHTAPRPPQRDWAAVLALHVALSAIIALAVAVVWHVTGRGVFWPVWVWFALGIPIAVHVAAQVAGRVRRGPLRLIALHGALSAVVVTILVALWLLTGSEQFWLAWPLFGLSVVLAAHGVVALFWPRIHPGTERELTERVDQLTRTRRGALDVQAAELRRIERDLHDGAQARLVALTMQLGRAEERLEDRPEDAALVRAAREEASAAIGELRDLARGISPPVLADRGLTAAVDALARRAAIPVQVTSKLDDSRLPPVVENAAYFVVSEALTNIAKHARGASARVELTVRDNAVVVIVADDGPGGANPDGSGLTGLRRRAEALDGRLDVLLPPGGGTTIRAELPCGS